MADRYKAMTIWQTDTKQWHYGGQIQSNDIMEDRYKAMTLWRTDTKQ